MSRIFSGLSVFAVLLTVVTLFFGLYIGDYNAAFVRLLEIRKQLPHDDQMSSLSEEQKQQAAELQRQLDQQYQQLEPLQQRARLHVLLGILSGLVVVLVNSISVTYFIGTNRWCKEVVETYGLDPELARQTSQNKRRTFPWSLLGIVTVLVITTFGAAADPGTLRTSTAWWVTPHLIASLLGTALIAVAFMMQVISIQRNTELVDEVLQRVQTIRAERGLDQQI